MGLGREDATLDGHSAAAGLHAGAAQICHSGTVHQQIMIRQLNVSNKPQISQFNKLKIYEHRQHKGVLLGIKTLTLTVSFLVVEEQRNLFKLGSEAFSNLFIV